jgi:ATP-binding cassette subfamily C protein
MLLREALDQSATGALRRLAAAHGLAVDEATTRAELIERLLERLADPAYLAEQIEALPMGMQTYVTEGGATFSGGQRQLLLIARALVRKPRILLFDEATSALDNRTQAIVSESVDRLQATRIVIAHRLSTIEKADRIYVLWGGRIAQQGPYRDLIAAEGPFAELARRQLA